MAQYYRPQSLNELLQHRLAGAQVVAGATDIYPGHTQSHAWGSAPAANGNRNWLDITAVDELRGIHIGEQEIRLGALVTWSELVQTALPCGFTALIQAAREIGGAQIQNRATIVGNLCNASPAADGVPPLLCLDAEVEMTSLAGSRRLPLRDFIVANRKTQLSDDEIVTALIIPTPMAQYRSAFYKLGARRYLVISIVMAAIALDLDDAAIVRDARVTVGACSACALRLTALEQKLVGVSLQSGQSTSSLTSLVASTDFDQLQPIDDVRASAAYRNKVAVEVCRRLLTTVAREASKA